MSKNDNSVNIKKPGRKYHHGDLRAALVAAGLDLLKEKAADDLSLREVARIVGVSATAVYRHFPDKQTLLHVLCEIGAEGLASALRNAVTGAGGGRLGFEASGRAYVRFALANPTLFRLMMTSRPSTPHFDPDRSAVSSAMQLLRGSVAEVVPSNATKEQRKMIAIQAWSLVHGLAMLILDGQISADDKVIDRLVTNVWAEP